MAAARCQRPSQNSAEYESERAAGRGLALKSDQRPSITLDSGLGFSVACHGDFLQLGKFYVIFIQVVKSGWTVLG